MCVNVTVSEVVFESWAAVTVTVCAVLQFAVVNASDTGPAPTPRPAPVIDTVTPALGSVARATV